MDAHPELEAEMYIAQKLGWKSVKKMRKGMSNFEYEKWVLYYQRIKQRQELESKMKAK